MKAAQVKDYGESDVVVVGENVPEPIPNAGQVLVEVYGSSVNPFDLTLLSGIYKNNVPMKFPYIPGGDFSGKVTQIGKGVTEFKIGDEVFGSASILNGGSGAFALNATANTKNIAHKPSNLDFIQAASLPLVGSSAVQALEDHIKLKANQKILVHGGAGGIGSIAIQIAKYIGAYVATTVGTDDKGFARILGADQVIDYKKEKFEEILKDFDAVFDTVGGKTTDKSFRVLKKGAILVSMLGAPNEELAKQHGVRAIGQGTETNSAHLSRLAELVDQGAIKPQVDKVFSLEQASEAFVYQQKGSPRGKVVIKINS